MLRYGVLIAGLVAAFPAQAQEMGADEARKFVVGKLFSYTCFEGTRGAGRITDNLGVAGTIQFRGNGGTRYAVLPPNTLRVAGNRVCASVKGMPFEPCFNILKTSASSFRGSLSGLGFAYCDFTRRDRPAIAQVLNKAKSQARAQVEMQNSPEPVKPVEAQPLPPTQEQAPAKANGDEPLELRSSKQ